MQLGPPVKHRLGVLGHPLAELGGRGIVARRNGVMSANPDAAAAADAAALVDRGLMILPEADRPVGALLAQKRQPTHLSVLMYGLPQLCCSIFPAREPHPIPMFLIAPPKPVCSCPLKWLSEMITSASMMARPILAF